MLSKEKCYGTLKGVIKHKDDWIDDNVFFLSNIDEKWRRKYDIKNAIGLNKKSISSMMRLENLKKGLGGKDEFSKFYKLSVNDRI